MAGCLVLGACAGSSGNISTFSIVANVEYEPGGCEEIGRQYGRHLDAAALSAEATGQIDVTYGGDIPDDSPEIRRLYLWDDLYQAHFFTLRSALADLDLDCDADTLHAAAMPEVSARACDLYAERVRGRGDGEHGTTWDCDAWQADVLRILRLTIPHVQESTER